MLREDLGEKFEEYEPMKRSLLEKLKRVNEKCQRSRILLSSIQHVYSYSKWDQVHEPNNVVENVCRDNEEVCVGLHMGVVVVVWSCLQPVHDPPHRFSNLRPFPSRPNRCTVRCLPKSTLPWKMGNFASCLLLNSRAESLPP